MRHGTNVDLGRTVGMTFEHLTRTSCPAPLNTAEIIAGWVSFVAVHSGEFSWLCA
jgi:hypothetical protein